MVRFSFSKRHIFISVRYTLHLVAHPLGKDRKAVKALLMQRHQEWKKQSGWP